MKYMNRLTFLGKVRKPMCILGTGGIGSNVVRYLDKGAKLSSYQCINLYEMDTVELSNLNRSSLFRVDDIGKPKVYAVNSNREDLPDIENLNIYAYTIRINSTSLLEGLIVDCRDTIDPNLLPPATWIKASYNGGSSMSWHFLPSVTNHAIWRSDGGDNSYEVTPSFYVPAAMSGLITKMFSTIKQFTNLDPEKHSRIVRFNIDHAIKQILERKEEESNEDKSGEDS